MSEIQVHSSIGASSMHRWSACPGSVKLCKGIPSVSSKYAEEGTRAHEVAADLLNGIPQGCSVDPEMLEAVMVYVNEVKRCFALGKNCTLLIEHKFDLSTVHPGLFGTADAVIFNPSRSVLQVFDYKHGAGIPVGVEENQQLMYYGLGALLSTKFICSHVELIIVQPRCEHADGPIRRWLFEAYKLIDFAAELKEAALRTEEPNAPLNPGDHCRFCPAAPQCPAIHQKALSVAKAQFSVTGYDPRVLSNTLNWLPTLEAFIKNVREFAYAEAEHGRCPPGYKLVEKRATRKWRDEQLAVKAIEKSIHHTIQRDCFTEPELKSVAQVEKILGKKDFSLLEDQVIKESSGLTLTTEDDKRPQVKIDAKSQFTQIETKKENNQKQGEDFYG